MYKPTSKLTIVAVAIIGTTLAITAQKTERTEVKTYNQRVESHNPGFVPILTVEDAPAGTSLASSITGDQAVGSISLSRTPRQNAESGTDVPVLYGCVLSSQTNPTTGAKRSVAMYSFKDDVFTQKNSGTKATQAQGSGAKVGSNYYALRRTNTGKMYVDRFTTSNWSRAAQNSVTNVGLRASDVAYDPTSDIVYGCFYNDAGNGYVFGKIDYATRVRTAIKSLDMQWNAVMADNDGQIYAIDMNGDLLKVNKTTGDYTVIGNTGVVPAYQTSATIDLATGRCFWVAMPTSAVSSLYEVDLNSATATKLYDFSCNDEIVGMFAEEAPTPSGAPAAVQNLTADFSESSLSGTVTFTTPATYADNSAASGNVDYKLWCNGVLITSGSASYGEDVSLPLTVDKGDKYYIVVACSNEAGRGPIARVAKFIGNDTPKAPAPSLSRENDEFIISWEKVTASVNGGYINPDGLTYTIRRFPDNVLVAENIAETSYRDLVPEVYGQMIPYYYTVSATFDGNTGAAGTTNLFPLGTIVPPYHEGFDDAESMNNFIVLDSNGDGTKWIYSSNMSSAYITNSSKQHDDWLITAGMYLTAGKTYTLSFSAMASFDPERLEVKMGSTATAEGMTRQLVDPIDLAPDFSMESNPVDFTVEESGVYHIGFHAISDPAFYLYVDNIVVNCEGGEAAALDPPYLQTFDKSSVLSQFTVIDANSDGKMWNIDRGVARVEGSSQQPMNDWLISPPLNLKSGARYNIRLDAFTTTGNPEKFEVLLGKENSVDALTETVIGLTTVTGTDPEKFEKLISVPEDGIYYFAVHGCSDPGSFELRIDNLEIAAPVFDNAPGLATDGSVVGADYGELKATVSFKAPTTNVIGGTLESITSIDVYYGDDLVKSFGETPVGETVSFEAEVSTIGMHTWEVICSNEYGAGLPYEVSGYVGVGVPEPPTNVVATEDGNTGKVTLTWNAPTKDVNGRALNPDGVTYMVVELVGNQQLLLAQNVTSTTYTLQAVGPDTRAFKMYAIFPVTAAGIGRGTPCSMTPVGMPETAPWSESAADGEVHAMLGSEVLYPEASWTIVNDGLIGLDSYDHDNGFFAMKGENLNAAAGLISGKIDLSALSRPALTFYTYNIEGEFPDDNILVIQVAKPGENFETVAQNRVDQLCDDFGWNRVRVDLSEFAGQTIRIRIAAVMMGYFYTMVDAISIGDAPAIDAEALSVTAPESVETGKKFNINVKVRNEGLDDLEGAEVVLYMNGEEFATETLPTLASLKTAEVVFTHSFNALDANGEYQFHAVVNHPQDENENNNTLDAITVNHLESSLPVVQNLQGRMADNEHAVELSWDTPASDDHVLFGYNIYRDTDLIVDAPVKKSSYTDSDLPLVCPETVEYAVSSVWSAGESKVVSVCVNTSGVDMIAGGTLSVMSVDGGIEIKGVDGNVTVVAADGIVMFDQNVAGSAFVSLAPGVYVVKANGLEFKINVNK